MQESKTVGFKCQSCDKELPLNLARYPQQGGTFPCPSCRAPLTLPPLAEFVASQKKAERPPETPSLLQDPWADPAAPEIVTAPPSSTQSTHAAGAPERRRAPAAETSPKPEDRYRVALPAGGVEEMTRMEIWQAIRRGELDGRTEITHQGSDAWKPLSAYPELARLFEQHLQSLASRQLPSNTGVPAPFPKRIVAKVIDLFLLWILMQPIRVAMDRKYLPELQDLEAQTNQVTQPPAPAPPAQQPPSYSGPSRDSRAPRFGPATPEEANRARADEAWRRSQEMQRQQQVRDQQEEAQRQEKRKQLKSQLLLARYMDVMKRYLWEAIGMALLSQLLFVVLPLALSGASIGKLAMGLRVRRPDGGDIGFLRALGRTFAEIPSACILYIGYLMAFLDDERRTLHDRLAGTRVELR